MQEALGKLHGTAPVTDHPRSGIPWRGTALNTLGVLVGGLLGVAGGRWLGASFQEITLLGIGLVTVLMAVKLFLSGQQVLITVAAVVVGGLAGHALGLHAGLEAFAAWVQTSVGGQGTFSEGLLTAAILFCVGPMTLLGCLREGLTGDAELIQIKSLLDTTAAFFLAAALGVGVVFSAGVVLVVQGTLTLGARAFRPLMDRAELLAEMSAVGGVMLLAVGLNLLGLVAIPVADLLPALALAPVLRSRIRFANPVA